MGMPALGVGDVVDRDCKMYAVLNDMALTRPDPRHPFHVQAQIASNPSCSLSTRSTRSHAAGIIRAVRNARSILTTARRGLLCAQVRLRSLRRRPQKLKTEPRRRLFLWWWRMAIRGVECAAVGVRLAVVSMLGSAAPAWSLQVKLCLVGALVECFW
jgi:hypothetical protein